MKKIFIFLIRFYQKAISPSLGKNCIYTPTCSEYTIEAIKEYGCIKGVIMGIKRILRCRPGKIGGYDPVPKKENNT
jgi:putative membrane protein insertion efficiency factor